jgi:hypothetical protein
VMTTTSCPAPARRPARSRRWSSIPPIRGRNQSDANAMRTAGSYLQRMSFGQACRLLVLLLLPSMAGAQATLDMPLDGLSSVRLVRLVTIGLIDTAITGQQPFTRREAVRMIASARRTLESGGNFPAVAEVMVAGLERELRDADRTALLHHVEASVRATNASPRELPSDLIGSIDAWTNIIVLARAGEPIGRGGALVVGSRHSARIARWLTAEARPRATTTRSGVGGPDRAPHLDLRTAQLRAAVGSFTLDAGRSELSLGHGIFGRPAVDGSAPPLPMLRIGNDQPISLPILTRVLGPVRGTLFVADLGADQNFPHARLAGWKLSFLPHQRLELGVTVLSHQGGGGAPPARLRARVADLVPLYDAILLSGGDLELSNKFSGIDVRYRAPWHGLQLHWEVLLDDWDERRLRSTWWEDASHVVGASLPQMHDGSVALLVEAHHTGIRMYRHGQFTSGLTRRGRLIGNPLGPNANALYARLVLDRGVGTVWEADGAWEMRSGKRYSATGGYGAETLRFHEIERHPHEYRRRIVVRQNSPLEGSYPFLRQLRVLAEAGLEHVRNDGHTPVSRWNVVARLGGELHF